MLPWGLWICLEWLLQALEHPEDLHLDQNAQTAVASVDFFGRGTMPSAPSSEATFAVSQLLGTQNPNIPSQSESI